MCCVLGDVLEADSVAKIADDLFCGTDSPEELFKVWSAVLHIVVNLRPAGVRTAAFTQ